jgi:hypothetical protein
MLERSYNLNLGHLFKIAHELKKYLWQKLKLEKTQNVTKTTTDKQVGSLVLELGIVVIAIDNPSRKNTIKDVFLDGGSRINIIIK